MGRAAGWPVGTDSEGKIWIIPTGATFYVAALTWQQSVRYPSVC